MQEGGLLDIPRVLQNTFAGRCAGTATDRDQDIKLQLEVHRCTKTTRGIFMTRYDSGRFSKTDLEMYRVSERYRTARRAISYAGIAGCVYLFGKALEPFAGEITFLSVALSILGDLKFTVTIALAGAAVAWAVVERMLRYRKTRYLQDRIKELELTIDPHRSTSGLHPTGKTNPRDRRK